jgi:hypothetical protein
MVAAGFFILVIPWVAEIDSNPIGPVNGGPRLRGPASAAPATRPGLGGPGYAPRPIAADVTRITPLYRQAFNVHRRNLQGRTMLLLTAILRVWSPRDPEANDLLAGIRLRVGHLGLTIIALVYVLISFWQR